MTVQFIAKELKPQASDVFYLEKKLGKQLPKDYRDFISINNVAIPEANQFTNKLITTSVSKFFGISKRKGDDLIAQNEIYDGRLPKNIITIGLAGGGNLICLRLEDGNTFFWDHEQEATEGEEPSFDNMVFLTHSFGEFLKMLQGFRVEDVVLDAENILSVVTKPGFNDKFKNYK